MSGPYAEPRKLAELAQRLAAHASGPLAVDRSLDVRGLLARLTEQLGSVSNNSDARALVASLTPREQRALVGLIPLFEDEAVAGFAALAVAQLQRRLFCAMAPQFLIRNYRRSFAKVAAVAFLDNPPADAPAQLRLLAAVRRRGLRGVEAELVAALMREEVGWARVCADLGADPKASEVAAELAFALLCAGRAQHLAGQPEDDLRACFGLLARDDWPAAVNGYFGALDKSRYAKVALDAVIRELGPPRTSGDPRWRLISAEVASRIHEEVIRRSLQEFFSGQENHERFGFWFGYALRMTRVHTRLEGAACLMDFGGFGVIEFRDVGNAAYFYPSDEFARLRDLRAHSPSALKIPSRALARLTHARSWRETCRQILAQLGLR